MNDPRHQLTPLLQQAICGIIVSGAFPEVAAAAQGIPPKVFHRWMKWGKAARPVEVYRNFYEAVSQAQKTDARITELSGAASRIGDVVKMITAIAEAAPATAALRRA